MPGWEFVPGEWPKISRREYERLRLLASRRLRGHEHLADDVVSRSLLKWTQIPLRKRAVARIEQVIKTECWSVLRSELRARERDTRAAVDPTVGPDRAARHESDVDLQLLRQAVTETCCRERIPLTALDVEVFELLCAGFTLAEAGRALGATRHDVRRSQSTWRRVIGHTLSNDRPEVQPG